MLQRSFLLIALILAAALTCAGDTAMPTIFTQRAPLVANDTRQDWSNGLLKLSLEKTLADFGPYRIETAPALSIPRQWQSLKTNRYPNYFYGAPFEPALREDPDLAFVPFPVERGMLGYRVCFVPANRAAVIRERLNTDRIRELVHGQVEGWTDVDILRINGFQVIETAHYENLFGMVAAGRFDLFCRGISEVKAEYEQHRELKNFALDRHFVIHYPFPVFFFTHRSNAAALKRVETGLKRAFDDGSLRQLSLAHYGAALDFIQLNKRKLIALRNPMLDKLDPSYQRYNFQFAPGTGPQL